MTFCIELKIWKENILVDEKTKTLYKVSWNYSISIGSFFQKQVIICNLHFKSKSKLLFFSSKSYSEGQITIAASNKICWKYHNKACSYDQSMAAGVVFLGKTWKYRQRNGLLEWNSWWELKFILWPLFHPSANPTLFLIDNIENEINSQGNQLWCCTKKCKKTVWVLLSSCIPV